MAPHRRQIGASRRRRRDEGEDEGSTDGLLEDDSLSETSIVSNQDDDDADGEGSDVSDDETPGSPKVDPKNNLSNGRASEAKEVQLEQKSGSPGKPLFTSILSDTEAMLNGMKISGGASRVAEIQFGDMKEERDTEVARTPSAPPTEPRAGSFADRRRREQEQNKERGESRATSTSGVFSHGKRSTESSTNGYRPFNKSKSRPYGLIVDGNIGR